MYVCMCGDNTHARRFDWWLGGPDDLGLRGSLCLFYMLWWCAELGFLREIRVVEVAGGTVGRISRVERLVLGGEYNEVRMS